MIPPTSIDGTDITGATIDGTDVTEITVDGTKVFPDFPKVVDDFESGNLNAYTNTSNFSVTSNTVIQGSNSLELNNPNSNFDMFSDPGDGLANYPQKGDKFSVLIYDEGDGTPIFLFGWDGANQDGYFIFHSVTTEETGIIRVDSGSATQLFRQSASISANEWYEYEIQWHDGSGSLSDNTIQLTIFDIDSNLNRTGQVLTTSVSDGTYATNKGIGFGDGNSAPTTTAFIDNYVILGEVD